MTAALSIAPELALALALRGTPGAYAVLLGSGVSRAADIPTGWDIVLDLTRKVAAAEQALDAAGGDPAAWYQQRFGEEPSYTRLLEMLAPSQVERRELLRRYFEPTEQELADGRKTPTKAHRAIAQLVAKGYVRVVLTTNFDRLMETALQDAGVPPAVIASADAAAGALPLQHERVTVIKLHGDYLDSRIKNTPDELAAYDPAMDRLLDRVLDEYGLVVCGWSATWDEALLRGFDRCSTRRFSTYWAQRGELSGEARRLVDRRRAALVAIEGADAFFEAVLEKVEALEEVDRPHPVSKAAAVASLKRYLPVEEARIRLHDLVMAEVDAARSRGAALLENLPGGQRTDLAAMALKLEGSVETLVALLAVGAYWGEGRHMPLWRKALERVATIPVTSTLQAWLKLGRYPAQLAFYAVGLALTAQRQDDLLTSWLKEPRIVSWHSEEVAPVFTLSLYAAMGNDEAKHLPGLADKKTAMSDHLHRVLRAAFAHLVPDDAGFDDVFDRFEYVVALAYIGHKVALANDGVPVTPWGPLGRFAWTGGFRGNPAVAAVTAEIEKEGADWFLLRHGFYKGDQAELKVAKTEFDKHAARFRY